MQKISLISPAKINLFFRITGKREDGFHEIASLMQAVSLFDVLHLERSKQDSFVCSNPAIQWNASNTIFKAVHFFRKKTRFSHPLKICLKKNIPMEAGLGGGSSNLATTLWALNTLFARLVPIEELRDWAGELSCDASFFFSCGSAYVNGRGEQVQDLSPLPPIKLYLAKPEKGLSTPLVYKYSLPNTWSPMHPFLLLLKFQEEPWPCINDLEGSAFFLMPELKQVKSSLLSLGFHTVCMTGSGSAFFCIGEISNPCIPQVCFYPISFISRNEGKWYE